MKNKIILLRDHVSDTGTTPSHGSWYSSPDLIAHSQVADPQSYFKDNYGSDVNMPLNSGSMSNLIYTRVKNISDKPLEAYIRCYATLSSLFLNSSYWKDNPMLTVSGKGYTRTGLIQPGEIGVGIEPFIFNGQIGQSFCHTGYIMDSNKEPDFPEEFKDYDGYAAWVHGCTNVANRNHTRISGQKSSYEQVDQFSNPSSNEPRVAAFLIALSKGFPVGTRVVVNCEPLGIINQERTVTDSSQPLTFTVSGIVPPSFNGIVRTAVYLPSGTTWPQGGFVVVEAFVNWTGNRLSEPYIVDFKLKPILEMANAGKLIHIGTCSTEFIK